MATTTKKAILLATSLASITATGTSLAHANDQGLTKSIISKAERIKRTETHARKAEEINKRSEDETNQKRLADNKLKNKHVSPKKIKLKKHQKKKHQKRKKLLKQHLLKMQHLLPTKIHVSAQTVF